VSLLSKKKREREEDPERAKVGQKQKKCFVVYWAPTRFIKGGKMIRALGMQHSIVKRKGRKRRRCGNKRGRQKE